MQEHALSPPCDKGLPSALPIYGQPATPLYGGSPSPSRHDEKPLGPLIVGHGSLGIQPDAIAGMSNLQPLSPAQPLTRKVPVPLDELLRLAGEFSEGGRLPEGRAHS